MEETKNTTQVNTETENGQNSQSGKNGKSGEYHDVLWYAVQGLKENAMQSTWKSTDIPSDCCDKDKASCGGCASCGFKCAKSLEQRQNPDVFAERNPVNFDEAPDPETTFPLPQVVAAVVACILGCFAAQTLITNLLGH